MSEPVQTNDANAGAALDFERAEFAEPAPAEVRCGLCNKTLTSEYWHSLGKVLCATCRDAVRLLGEQAKTKAAFGKALLLGGAVALGCGTGYAIFVGLTKIQFALVTIAIGWAVGRTIQRVTRGFGARRHQVLAVALTYFASSMGYLPAIMKAIDNASASHQVDQTQAAPPSSPTAPATAAPPPPEAPPASAEQRPGLVTSLVVVLGIVAYYMLAAPFYGLADGFGGILGLLIIFFGLRTAWRVSKGLEGVVTGPYQVGAPAP